VSIFIDTPSPFDLPAPSEEWCRVLEQYDPDLRIFRSVKHPVYRLARVAKNSAGLTAAFFDKIPNLNPDTATCIRHGIVAVPLTLHTAAIQGAPQLIVDRLQRRDVWRHGGWERVADILDEQDRTRENQVAAERQDSLRVRSRAMRTGFQYRTGARVSLVSPVRARVPDRPAAVESVAAADPTTGQ
jgi:hypothetical protein